MGTSLSGSWLDSSANTFQEEVQNKVIISYQPEVVVVDELWPLLVFWKDEGVDVGQPDHREGDDEENLCWRLIKDLLLVQNMFNFQFEHFVSSRSETLTFFQKS